VLLRSTDLHPISAMFFEVVVQSVLLFGSEMFLSSDPSIANTIFPATILLEW
jgi:hypothetical protein